jgi:hypothetical protein
MKAICSLCHKECHCKVVNEGIGAYEYWGAPCYDQQPVVISSCCSEQCIDEHGLDITPSDVKDFDELMKAESRSL